MQTSKNITRGSILDEKSGLRSCEKGNKTNSLLTKRTTSLPDLSLKDKRASPKIGIVIPIYNVAKYLRQCLDSVLNQTYGNFHAVLVNDGSNDILSGESKNSPSLAEGDKGGGCYTQNISNAKFANSDFTHPLRHPSARDGEQKAESLKIALEYVAKDERFVLIDKANGGLSSARNVGISYFTNSLVGNSSLGMQSAGFANKAIQTNNLDCHDFANAKSHNDESYSPSIADGTRGWAISPQMTFYTRPNHTNLNPPKIDYIIFLDSDDFWEVNLLESCVESMQQNDNPNIIWFDWRESYETYESKISKNPHSQTMLEIFGYANPTKITAIEWLNRAKDKQIYQFWWAWQGLICFEYLKRVNLRFLDGIIFEDNLFGILLFLQSESIAIMPRKLYNYRIRANSTTNIAKNTKSLPPFVEPLRVAQGDLAWEYFCAQSLCEIALSVATFCETYKDKEKANLCKANFLPHLLAESCDILRFKCDICSTKARFTGLLKKERENLQILQIISFITPRAFKGVRYFLFLLCIKPQLAIFRAMRKIRKILGLYRG